MNFFSDDKLLEEDGDEEYDLGEGDEEALLADYAEEVNLIALEKFSYSIIYQTIIFDLIFSQQCC